MKLIEKHFVDHFLRDRGPDDYFSPSDYQEALEMYEAGFRKAREMAADNACVCCECEQKITGLSEEEVKE